MKDCIPDRFQKEKLVPEESVPQKPVGRNPKANADLTKCTKEGRAGFEMLLNIKTLLTTETTSETSELEASRGTPRA